MTDYFTNLKVLKYNSVTNELKDIIYLFVASLIAYSLPVVRIDEHRVPAGRIIWYLGRIPEHQAGLRSPL